MDGHMRHKHVWDEVHVVDNLTGRERRVRACGVAGCLKQQMWDVSRQLWTNSFADKEPTGGSDRNRSRRLAREPEPGQAVRR